MDPHALDFYQDANANPKSFLHARANDTSTPISGTLSPQPSAHNIVAASQVGEFFSGLCWYLASECGFTPDEIIGGILSVHTRTATLGHIPENVRPAMMTTAALSRAMDRSLTFEADGKVTCWPNENKVFWGGDAAEEFLRSADHVAGEERLFEADAVLVRMQPVVVCKLPEMDRRLVGSGSEDSGKRCTMNGWSSKEFIIDAGAQTYETA